jgi:hypothetical protein
MIDDLLGVAMDEDPPLSFVRTSAMNFPAAALESEPGSSSSLRANRCYPRHAIETDPEALLTSSGVFQASPNPMEGSPDSQHQQHLAQNDPKYLSDCLDSPRSHVAGLEDLDHFMPSPSAVCDAVIPYTTRKLFSYLDDSNLIPSSVQQSLQEDEEDEPPVGSMIRTCNYCGLVARN